MIRSLSFALTPLSSPFTPTSWQYQRSRRQNRLPSAAAATPASAAATPTTSTVALTHAAAISIDPDESDDESEFRSSSGNSSSTLLATARLARASQLAHGIVSSRVRVGLCIGLEIGGRTEHDRFDLKEARLAATVGSAVALIQVPPAHSLLFADNTASLYSTARRSLHSCHVHATHLHASPHQHVPPPNRYATANSYPLQNVLLRAAGRLPPLDTIHGQTVNRNVCHLDASVHSASGHNVVTSSTGGWIRDLTTEGVEPNPGPAGPAGGTDASSVASFQCNHCINSFHTAEDLEGNGRDLHSTGFPSMSSSSLCSTPATLSASQVDTSDGVERRAASVLSHSSVPDAAGSNPTHSTDASSSVPDSKASRKDRPQTIKRSAPSPSLTPSIPVSAEKHANLHLTTVTPTVTTGLGNAARDAEREVSTLQLGDFLCECEECLTESLAEANVIADSASSVSSRPHDFISKEKALDISDLACMQNGGGLGPASRVVPPSAVRFTVVGWSQMSCTRRESELLHLREDPQVYLSMMYGHWLDVWAPLYKALWSTEPAPRPVIIVLNDHGQEGTGAIRTSIGVDKMIYGEGVLSTHEKLWLNAHVLWYGTPAHLYEPPYVPRRIHQPRFPGLGRLLYSPRRTAPKVYLVLPQCYGAHMEAELRRVAAEGAAADDRLRVSPPGEKGPCLPIPDFMEIVSCRWGRTYGQPDFGNLTHKWIERFKAAGGPKKFAELNPEEAKLLRYRHPAMEVAIRRILDTYQPPPAPQTASVSVSASAAASAAPTPGSGHRSTLPCLCCRHCQFDDGACCGMDPRCLCADYMTWFTVNRGMANGDEVYMQSFHGRNGARRDGPAWTS